jgi:hypothetical protein
MIYRGSSNSCGAVIICKEDNNCSLFFVYQMQAGYTFNEPLLDENDFGYRWIGHGGQKAIGFAH